MLALYQPRADAKGLILRLEIGVAPVTWVRGDPLRLRQILLNLLDNAIKFTRDGEVVLGADAQEDHLIRFTVRDTGIGIPQPVQEHIFQAFAQADGTVSRKFGGTGLGLAICRQLAHLMGGELELDSEPDRGSCFSFDLSLPPGQQGKRRQSDHLVSALPQFPGRRVLVAEDNPVNQKLAGFMLEDHGIEVVFADNGKAAYACLARESVDLVLMDCQMPEWDGLTATRAIRVREQEQNQPRLTILALSANAMPGFEETCHEAGMDAYLAKPLSTESLTAALLRWLPEPAPGAESVATEPPPELEQPGFDLEKIRRLCRNDGARITEMLTLFLSSSEDLLSQLSQSLEADNLPQAARLAHQIKGAAAYFGAEAARELASAMEAAAKAGDLETSRSAQEDLEAEFIRLTHPIHAELERQQTAGLSV